MAKEVAINFYEWLIDNGYCSRWDFEDDIDEMIEDFAVMQREVPRMFNLIRDICDR